MTWCCCSVGGCARRFFNDVAVDDVGPGHEPVVELILGEHRGEVVALQELKPRKLTFRLNDSHGKRDN